MTDEPSIEVLEPDDVQRPPAVTIRATRPNGTYGLTVRAGESKLLVATLSEAAGQLVEL